tara:strand:+ start:144 stop:572 length:429 start_codon:yes stop_codon:yes gene_type:complete
MLNKFLFIGLLLLNIFFSSVSHAEELSAYFIRPADAMTVGQGVQLHFDGKYIGKIWHDKYAIVKTKAGNHSLMTKVGLSISVPVTGFGGAKKFKSKFNLEKGDYYFKIEFKPGLLAGEHRIIKISKDEYFLLSDGASEIEYK